MNCGDPQPGRNAQSICGPRGNARSPIDCKSRRARKRESLTEWGKIFPDRGQFAGSGAVGIGRHWGRSIAAKAALEYQGRLGVTQVPTIQEQAIRIGRDLAALRQSRDWHALKGDKSKRALRAVGKESIAVTDGDKSHGPMALLK
jgi:hypothetical protein